MTKYEKRDDQKILASIGTPPGWHLDHPEFQWQRNLSSFYDKVTDVRSSMQPKCKAITEEDLEPNLGQHWDSSRITLGSYSTSKAKNYLINSIE